MYTIGEIARLSQVSIRTLHYYDEIELLPPSYVTEAGHRKYDEESLQKLYHILFLKESGFDLAKIKEIVAEQERQPHEILKLQLEALEQEQQELEMRKQRVQLLLDLVDYTGAENWGSIFSTLKGNPEQKKMNREQYFNKEELEVIDNLPKLGEESGKEWVQLMKDIQAAIDQNMDPGSEAAQELLKRWGTLTYEMFQGNKELSHKTWKAVRGRESELGFAPINHKVVNFIEEAYEVYRR